MFVSPAVDRLMINGESIDILSGMTDMSYIVEVPVEGAEPPRTQEVLHRFYPSSLQAAREKKPRAWRDEPRLAVEATAENTRIPEDTTVQVFGQTANVAPAMYTGKMCKVASLAMGLTKVAIQYQHSFFCTHGIFTAKSGALWLIEISMANGVVAMPLPVSKIKLRDKVMMEAIVAAGIPALPTGVAIPKDLAAAITDGRVLRLMTAAELNNRFYADHIPFYGDCGWAFSESGANAVNTSWNNVVEDDYIHSYLHRIDIIESDTGQLAAALTLVSSGILFNGNSATRFLVPSGQSADLLTFQMKKANTPFQDPPGETWGGPLHAFFVGEALKVYEQTVYKGGPSTPASGGYSPYDCFLVGGSINTGSDFGYTPVAKEAYISSTLSGEIVRGDSIDFSGPGITPPRNDQSYELGTHKIEDVPTGPYFAGPNAFAGGGGAIDGWLVTRVFTVVATSREETVPAEVVQNCLVISPKNRSCVFVGTTKFTGERRTVESKYFLGYMLKIGEGFDVWTNAPISQPPGQFYGGPWRVNYSGQLAQSNPQNSYAADILAGSSSIDYSMQQTINIGFGVVSASVFFPKGGNASDPFNLNNEMALSTSYEPVRDYSIGARVVRPSTREGTMTALNGPLITSSIITGATEETKFSRIFAVSPDVNGIFAAMFSSRSAFLGSSLASKNQGDLAGEGLSVQPADGEDMSELGILPSWVGYS